MSPYVAAFLTGAAFAALTIPAGYLLGRRWNRYGKAQWTEGYAQALLNHGVSALEAWPEAEFYAEPGPDEPDVPALEAVEVRAAIEAWADGPPLTYDLDHPAPPRVYPELAPEALDEEVMPHALPYGAQVDVSRPASSSSGRAGTPDLSDDPDLLEWDARANAARCGEIVVELRELGVMLAGWRPVLPAWDRELAAA